MLTPKRIVRRWNPPSRLPLRVQIPFRCPSCMCHSIVSVSAQAGRHLRAGSAQMRGTCCGEILGNYRLDSNPELGVDSPNAEEATGEEEWALVDWTTPLHTRGQVDRSAQWFADWEEAAPRTDLGLIPLDHISEEALMHYDVLGNWRASHSFPLNTIQLGLRRHVRSLPGDQQSVLVAQRLKRIRSIVQKVRRQQGMRLSRMQDIAGCRAILNDTASVYDVVSRYMKSNHKHELVKMNDYIASPKPDGYRSIHLIYKYRSEVNKVYDGLQVEIQIRSATQHAWATALETFDAISNQNLKSGGGDLAWRRFFALMGTAMAIHEGQPCVPGTPNDPLDLAKELSDISARLSVESKLFVTKTLLKWFPEFRKNVSGEKNHYYILTRDNEITLMWSYPKSQQHIATEQYSLLERDQQDPVLVSVDSVQALRRAYPNYFNDTTAFLEILRATLDRVDKTGSV